MRGRSTCCSGCGRGRIGRRWLGAFKSRRAKREWKASGHLKVAATLQLPGVVEDDAQRVAGATVDATDSVAQVDAIVAARTFYRSIARGEDDCLALVGGYHLGFGLRAGLLLH